jgi:hypothetical protein
MKFFDQYERFYATSQTGSSSDRLNGRYEAIIASNIPLISGKKVLDIASHDGRWSFAALQAGAAYVKGIEPRQELIGNAIDTFNHYGIDPARYDFECGSVFDLLTAEPFDVVFCLGFFYHTVRHAELLDRIERTGSKFVVLDTLVTYLSQEPLIEDPDDPSLLFKSLYVSRLRLEPVEYEGAAYSDSLTRNGNTPVERPSRATVRLLSSHFGYTCANFDWSAYFERNPDVSDLDDYRGDRQRETFYLSKP